MKKIVLLSTIFTIIFAQKIDPVTKLVVDVGLEDIKENCTVCHTGRFIVVNGGNKKFWYYKIKLMQKAYGLWDIPKDKQERIVNYLSKYYSKKINNISIEDH
jgi:hypothetical protein